MILDHVYKVRRFAGSGRGLHDVEWLAFGVLHIRFAEVFVFQHLREHPVTRLQPALRMAVRGGVIIWRADNSGQKRTLAQRQLPQVLAKVDHAGLRKTAHSETSAVTEIHLVRVHFKNALLGKALLEFEAQHGLGNFAAPIAVGGKEECASHLHGNGAGALQVGAVAQVVPGCAEDSDEVESRMLEKALIFRGADRVDQDGRNIFVADRAALLSGTVKKIWD